MHTCTTQTNTHTDNYIAHTQTYTHTSIADHNVSFLFNLLHVTKTVYLSLSLTHTRTHTHTHRVKQNTITSARAHTHTHTHTHTQRVKIQLLRNIIFSTLYKHISPWVHFYDKTENICSSPKNTPLPCLVRSTVLDVVSLVWCTLSGLKRTITILN